MCGVFGYITKNGRGPSIARLKRIAAETESRGHHAFGLAWLGLDGGLRAYKRPGAATANLGDLDVCRGAKAVVGHCRFATHGDPRDNRNNHPHPAGRGFLVHNGVVFNHVEIARHHQLVCRSECDSEVLGLLFARMPGSLTARAARVAAAAEGRLTILGVWKNPARLLYVRNGNPLCFGETDDGFYFGSLPEELPGPAYETSDRQAGLLTFGADGLRHETMYVPCVQRGLLFGTRR